MKKVLSASILSPILMVSLTAISQETPEAAARLVNAGKAVIVDVRSEKEWKQGHLAKAIWIPVQQIAFGQPDLSALPKDRPVYLHCAVGGRARFAARILKGKGFDARPLDLSPAELVKAGFAAAP